MTRETFRHLISDALENLYDPVHLCDHPLHQELIIEPLAGESPGEALRRVLRDAVEGLRPPDAVPPSRHEWLQYRVLVQHYVRCLTPDETCQEMSISRSSFYRRRREGLDAIEALLTASRISEREIAAGDHVPDGGAIRGQDDAERALALVDTMPRESFDLARLMHAAERTVEPLADQRRVRLHLHAVAKMPPAHGVASVLKQVVVGTLADCLGELEDDTLEIWLGAHATEARWRFHAMRRPDALAFVAKPSTSFWRRLLLASDGRIWFDASYGAGGALYLALPVLPVRSTILAIDDDPGATALYRRYLEPAGYLVLVAHSASEAYDVIEQASPDVILLDVILPQEDGWAILVGLRSVARAKDVPVVVCSVIEQPDVALALGAADVVNKPIGRKELLATIRKQLLRPDTLA
jgi:CheY-like chemotaxis protein